MRRPAASPARVDRSGLVTAGTRKNLTALVLILIIIAAVSVFVLEASQPGLAASSIVSRRLLEQDAPPAASTTQAAQTAAAPIEQYSAPSPPLPEAVERAIKERLRQVALQQANKNKPGGVAQPPPLLHGNASCPCKSDHDAVHESIMSQRICKVPQWMPRAWLTGQVIASEDDDLYRPNQPWQREGETRQMPQRGPHSSGILQPVTLRSFCIYGERCSGTTWITNLFHRNFKLIHNKDVCPNKHDFDLSVPNEFGFLAEDVLVLVITRNAVDWAVSMYNRPWFAANHCNVTFHEFVTKLWSPGNLSRVGASPAFCPKYERWSEEKALHSNMFYERGEGAFADNVLQVRSWKLQRQLQLCNIRRQSACVRYDDVAADWRGWLIHMRNSLHLPTRQGFPIEMSSYKGERKPKYVPHSELAGLKVGNSSKYYDSDATLRHMADSLNMHWEQRAGFNYDGAFARLETAR